MARSKTKVKCDKCGRGRNAKSVLQHKGKFKCFECRNKEEGMTIMKTIPHTQVDLSEALEKEYEVKGTLRKDEQFICHIYVPKILFGRKVKMVLQ